jgi:hypothetical protein
MTQEERDEYSICQALWDEVYEPIQTAFEFAREEWEEKHGWDDDYERCERCVEEFYRCERCAGLAESIEELGYCFIIPGELISDHEEYVYEQGGSVRWEKDENGVFQPRKAPDDRS